MLGHRLIGQIARQSDLARRWLYSAKVGQAAAQNAPPVVRFDFSFCLR